MSHTISYLKGEYLQLIFLNIDTLHHPVGSNTLDSKKSLKKNINNSNFDENFSLKNLLLWSY